MDQVHQKDQLFRNDQQHQMALKNARRIDLRFTNRHVLKDL